MLPLELGGVVDANLKVYGLANVRVADSSVFALEFAAHVSLLFLSFRWDSIILSFVSLLGADFFRSDVFFLVCLVDGPYVWSC